MEHLATIVVALITTGSLGTAFQMMRKAWRAQGDEGYQRRIKEEQGEKAEAAIGALESEVQALSSGLIKSEKQLLQTQENLTGANEFIVQQQRIIEDQARALSMLKAVS